MTEDRPPLSSVEAVRDELRRLGYLDHGLDRFVLGDSGGRTALRTSLRAALRVGIAGGILFGLASAAAAVGLDRRLLVEPRDLAVLALLLMVAAGIASAAAAAIGGLAAAFLARRTGHRPGPALARNIGLLVAILGLVYFALWWRSHMGSASPVSQVVALAVGLLLAMALGRFVSLAAVAVLVASGLGEGLARAGLARRHVLALVAAGLLLYAGVAGAAYFRPEPEAPDFAVVPTGLRVRLLAIDGLERRMSAQLAERGDMPNLAHLMVAGAHARLRAEPERVPAIVWTTVATGRGPEAHGIQAPSARRIAGLRNPVAVKEEGALAGALARTAEVLRLSRTEPASSVLRGVKTFWNVASEKGLRVGVVNWWATWPADAVNGYLVSDRAFFKKEKGGALDREVHPSEVFAQLPAPDPAADRALALDLFAIGASRALAGPRAPDLEAIYLPGLDITTMQQLGEANSADLATLDLRLAAVRAYYLFVDRLLGEAMKSLRPDDVLIVVGDPGRLARTGMGPAEGTLIVFGGPAQSGELGVVSERDVAPTVLHLVGLPVSREMEGRVLTAAFTPPFTSAHPVRRVPTYGRRPTARQAESAFDEEMLEQLKSLGYVK